MRKSRCGAIRWMYPLSRQASFVTCGSFIRYRMPPWIIPEFAPEEPAAKSFFSTSMVVSPRIAASRAMPVPLTPPPMTSRS